MNNNTFRSYMMIMEGLEEPSIVDTPITEDDFDANQIETVDTHQVLTDLLSQIKSYQDPDNGPNAEGIEIGMDIAANMLQVAIDKLRG